MTPPSIDARTLLYHYLHKELRKQDLWLFQMFAARLVTSLGVWISPSTYAKLPVILPFVVRDNSCRSRGRRAPDQWGMPDKAGYLRDDNSLVKEFPKTLAVAKSRNGLYIGRRLGTGFVASHVWRSAGTSDGERAPQGTWTNSFVPNLVWLPEDVAKLSDRNGSFVQRLLQSIAHRLYRNVRLARELALFTEAAWSHLPPPSEIPPESIPHTDELSFFEDSPRFYETRYAKIRAVRDALMRRKLGKAPEGKTVTTRYTEGLPALSWNEVRPLALALDRYLDALDHASAGAQPPQSAGHAEDHSAKMKRNRERRSPSRSGSQ